ncbi:MAG TPA: alpha/beta fold hydrolase [Streptosporangiaceae bacterium]|jgi:triacylglycerol lipase
MRSLVLALVCAVLVAVPGVASAAVSPPGANAASCKPSAAHPYPVVLVPGTFENQSMWAVVAPQLEAAGYCVFALDYGNNATGDIPTSAGQLGAFVDQVLEETGASKVDLVGHSQGGMMPRYWMEFDGGASKVDELIGIAPSNHGTTNPLAGPAGPLCPACAQQAAGSAFITNLNAGGDIQPGPSYTVISTRYDEVVTPYQSQALAGPASQVTNVVLQDKCPADISEHLTIPDDPATVSWVLDALGRPGPADPSFSPTCA